jgi:hypothetical protein
MIEPANVLLLTLDAGSIIIALQSTPEIEKVMETEHNK